MLLFGLHSTSDDQLGWLMDSNLIHHPSPAKKMKCSFFDYVPLLMIGWAGQWTWTPSASPLQPKKWNATFWITFNFWWLAGLVNGLKPHPPPLSSQRNEMLIFVLCSTSNDQPGLSMDLNPIHHPSPAKKMKSSFFITFNFWCWPDWSMDSNPILHLSPAKKNEMLVFRLRSLLMICLADWWTWTPSTTPLHPKTWNACLCITFNIWCWPDWSMDTNPICHPSSAKKMKSSFLYYLELLMISRAGWWTRTPSATPLQPKKMKSSFLDFVQLLMISLAGQWTQTPSATPLQQKNEMLIFGLHSTSDDWPGWLMDSNLIHHPSPGKKMKCSFLDCIHFWWLAELVDEL